MKNLEELLEILHKIDAKVRSGYLTIEESGRLREKVIKDYELGLRVSNK